MTRAARGGRIPRVLLVLAACGKSADAPAPSPPSAHVAPEAALPWPSAPAPTLPPDLELAWPPAFDDIARFEDGIALVGMTAYGVTIPGRHPRVFIKSTLDLRAFESVWGTLARDHATYAVWWNPEIGMRAREGVPHPTPNIGRGLELGPYVSTLDRIANVDEMTLEIAHGGVAFVPPGEWDPGPVTVVVTDLKPGRHTRFTVRVDGPPVDEPAVIAKLDEIWGTHAVTGNTWTWANGRVTARRVDILPALELTFR